MRAGTILAALFLTIGFTTMSDTATATADDKKEEKKNPDWTKKESYTEKVSVRPFLGGQLAKNPIKDVPACRGEIKGKQVIWVWWPGTTVKTPKDSEITGEDGVVWVVAESKRVDKFDYCYVTKKP